MKKFFAQYWLWIVLALAAVYLLYVLTRTAKAAGDVASTVGKKTGEDASTAVDNAFSGLTLFSPLLLWGSIAKKIGIGSSDAPTTPAVTDISGIGSLAGGSEPRYNLSQPLDLSQ